MARKINKNRSYKKSPEDKLVARIRRYFTNNPADSVTPKQLARKLDYGGKRNTHYLLKALLLMEDRNEVQQVEPELFRSKLSSEEVLIGKFDHVNARFGFVIPEDGDGDDDIKVSMDNMGTAMQNDVVRVAVSKGRGRSREGEIVEIISRARKEIVGEVDKHGEHIFVMPDNKRLHQDIYVPASDNKLNALNGDKVIVKITRYPRPGKKAEGTIIEVLGEAGSHTAEMHAIIAEYGLPTEFPEHVEAESEGISEIIPEAEFKKRRDVRNVPTFTIDPVDAKDFDDALSDQVLANGNIEVGVHIADVTHYVKEGSALEKEAFSRATSVYLVDRVIPMLPEKLSNGLCSLRPNEDKLCFSAIFELDAEAQVVSEWFGRTAIHSDRRFSYEEAQEILDGAEGDFKDEILSLNVLAHKLRKKRFAEGSISFETPEVKFKLDEDGTPVGLITKVRQDAHKLIEDFMLLANKKVAEFVFKKKEGKLSKTFIYRVHENPNTEKLDNFINFAKRFGHEVSFDGSVSSGLNKLTAEIEGKPEESVLQSLAIRAMAKARYTTETLGHFGLGFNHYSHFTSPIRRYPDMMVHRLLQRYLDKGNSVDQADYEEKCEHTSEREGVASQAERESIKYKQVEYMSKAETKVYEGVISGVTDFGLFVELIETKCEGMIRVSSLEDDYYEYDASKYQIMGRGNKKVFAFGDKVTVRVVRTDLRSRTIDLDLIDKV